MKALRLKSKNIAIFRDGNETHLDSLIIVKPIIKDNKLQYYFMGGFVSSEARRKWLSFCSLDSTILLDESFLADFDIHNVDFRNLTTYLGKYGDTFKLYYHVEISDYRHGGQEYASTACSSRFSYYDGVGMEEFKNSMLYCPIWAILANHVSIFSANQVELTLGGKKNDLMTGTSISSSVYNIKHKYAKYGFYAPA